MASIAHMELVNASVAPSATFADAADVLIAAPVETIAVVDEAEHVVGLFDGEALLRGLFPAYLDDLRHTAFATDDVDLLKDRAREVGSEPIQKHLREPVTVSSDSSATHVAERFLHTNLEALPVVEGERFLGLLSRSELYRVLLRD